MGLCGVTGATVIAGCTAAFAVLALQTTTTPTLDAQVFRDYAGAYEWKQGGFIYLQPWSELTGKNDLVAFDEAGDVRVLYPADRDRFTAGRAAAVPTPVESEVAFERDRTGKVVSLSWSRNGAAPRVASRADTERSEEVRFRSGDIQLAGTLIRPNRGGRHAAIILVHGSGAEDREYILPYARFLIRHGVAVLGYDKRGVGGSGGDWKTASFQDLAGDVVAAFNYLKTRRDIDVSRIGLLGLSQAGWVMPLAAVAARDIAFLISVSGAGISAADTTIDQARNEMTARGMRPQGIEQIVELMKLQYEYARTGQGWDEYMAMRAKIAARLGGAPPDTFPGTQQHPSWQTIRQSYFHDPAPILRKLQTPTLAIFGELDNNIVAEKNKAAWEAALKAGGHRDYTLRILPKANHLQFEAKVGSIAEMPTLQRFVPEYFPTVREWLSKRVKGFRVSPG
jgi:uncharacterized protein